MKLLDPPLDPLGLEERREPTLMPLLPPDSLTPLLAPDSLTPMLPPDSLSRLWLRVFTLFKIIHKFKIVFLLFTFYIFLFFYNPSLFSHHQKKRKGTML